MKLSSHPIWNICAGQSKEDFERYIYEKPKILKVFIEYSKHCFIKYIVKFYNSCRAAHVKDLSAVRVRYGFYSKIFWLLTFF